MLNRTVPESPHTPQRRRLAALALALIVAGSVALVGAGVAGAQGTSGSGSTTAPGAASNAPTTEPASSGAVPASDVVVVARVSGLIDPIVADYMERTIARAEEDGLLGVVFQFNSGGAVIDRTHMTRLATRMRDSKVQIGVWVGPSGAKARGGAAQLVHLADEVAMAPKTRIGDFGLDAFDRASIPTPLSTEQLASLRDRTVGTSDAVSLGVAEQAPVIGDFLVNLPGFRTEVDTSGTVPQRRPLSTVSFSPLPLISNQMHTVASLPVAYLLFLVGLGLLIFEFYTAGIGIAGFVGAGSFVLGCYGLDVLPARWWAVALLVVAMFGFAVDVQTGVPRVWTGDRRGVSHRRVHLPLQRVLDAVADLSGRHRRGAARHDPGHAGHGAHPLLHADHRPRMDGRRGWHRRNQRRPRGRGARARCPVAGPHESGHTGGEG